MLSHNHLSHDIKMLVFVETPSLANEAIELLLEGGSALLDKASLRDLSDEDEL